MTLKTEILTISRQNQMDALSPWFDAQLDARIQDGTYVNAQTIADITAPQIVAQLKAYRLDNKINTVVLGMSGGVDSALTARLFQIAGWTVQGLVMPIHQDPVETQRGIEACERMGIDYQIIDLSDMFDAMHAKRAGHLPFADSKAGRIRQGNLRARLRMITAYDTAAALGGLVASTDNFSELSAGFWTICGDVGDISPIQNLLKSWEVPALARAVDVPDSIWKAKPTDGLGVDDGDEAQLGASYLEWDLMLLHLMDNPAATFTDERAQSVARSVRTRMGQTWFKRFGPIMLPGQDKTRYTRLEALDATLQPDVMKTIA